MNVVAHISRIEVLSGAINHAIEEGAEEGNKEVTNYFAHGTYGRELFIKKDTFLVGKVHRHEAITILLKGKCRFATDSGDYDVEAPYTWVAGTGNKGIFAYEDSLLLVVHANPDNLTDLGELEKNIVAPSYDALEKL